MSGAEQECEKYKDDMPFYHFVKATILDFKGMHKEELMEIKLAEDACDGDTAPLVHFQIVHNRGVALIGTGEYRMAQDCFQKAIDIGNEYNIRDSELWLNTYYNYVFNQTRITPKISIQECLDMLEPVKKYIDIEDPKQYIAYSDIVIEILRQKKADKKQIDEVINGNFEYLVNANLTDIERCSLEASTARMVCTGRLNPNFVIEKLSKDIELFSKLPMPIRYRCFKEIDYMFKDLGGPITKKNHRIKEKAHRYIVNQAINDLDDYKSRLPSEAIYEICYCLKEKAGLMKYKPDQYDWDEFLKTMCSAQMLYKENELLAKDAICDLDIMDEATAKLNLDSELRLIHLDVMQKMLGEVEKLLPDFMEHPVLNEIYLRLSLYCLAMDDIVKSKAYYRKFQELQNFSIDHFAPWLRGKYSILSLYMFVIGYIESAERITEKDLSREPPQIQEWFREFHNRNGYFEAVVLGRILGGEILPFEVEFGQGTIIKDDGFVSDDIKSAYLVLPAINTKINCNGNISEILNMKNGIFSEWNGQYLQYCDLNALPKEIQQAIERISQMIKAEMPNYLVSSEELNKLVAEHWFDKC